jgi:hypothetical protein
MHACRESSAWVSGLCEGRLESLFCRSIGKWDGSRIKTLEKPGGLAFTAWVNISAFESGVSSKAA